MKKLALLATAVLMVACGGKGSEYLGQWQSSKYPNRTVAIERNGDSFLVKETAPSFWGKGMETKSIPAVLKDGMLQVQTGFGAANLTHVKESDTLLMPTMGGSAEYKRVTK